MTIFYREYDNYDEYLRHQSSKLNMLLKKGKSVWNRSVRLDYRSQRARKFQKIFKRYVSYMRNGNVLCLGARNGAEVKALRDMGFDGAIGIDLNPGRKNKYVIKGDFHDMPFEDNFFRNVFTNSLDHIFDIRKLSKEIYRVMKPSGRLILEISHLINFEEENIMKFIKDDKLYESFCCNDFKDIEEGFKEFKIIKNFKIDKRLVVVLEK